jgi:hypothetical protein
MEVLPDLLLQSIDHLKYSEDSEKTIYRIPIATELDLSEDNINRLREIFSEVEIQVYYPNLTGTKDIICYKK